MKREEEVDLRGMVVRTLLTEMARNGVTQKGVSADTGFTGGQLSLILAGKRGFQISSGSKLLNYANALRAAAENVRAFKQGLDYLECWVSGETAYAEPDGIRGRAEIREFWVEATGRVCVACGDGKDYYVAESLLPLARIWAKQCVRERKTNEKTTLAGR